MIYDTVLMVISRKRMMDIMKPLHSFSSAHGMVIINEAKTIFFVVNRSEVYEEPLLVIGDTIAHRS